MKSFLLPLLVLLTTLLNAQISTLPYAQSFNGSFAEGTNIQFISNFTGNEVSSSSRIFRDVTDFNSAPAAMSIIPTSSFNGEVIISLNLTTYSSVRMSFVAKSMLNGTGNRSAILTLSTSIDGGNTWIAAQELGTFPNENQTSFGNFRYSLPPEAFNQSDVKVRIRVTRSSGDGTTAKLVIDDMQIEQVVVPTLNANSDDLGVFLQILNNPSSVKTLSVDGLNLTGNLVVTAPVGYEVSLDSSDIFASSVSITPVSGAVPATTVFVRLNSNTKGDFSGNVVVSSTGISSLNVAVSGITSSPTNPASAFDLSSANYSFTNWSTASPAATYPANMAIWTREVNDASLSDLFSDDWKCLYNLTARSRVVGLGQNGIGFINTGSSQRSGDCDGSNPGTGDDLYNARVGALVLSLNTTGRQNVQVSWVGRTVEVNTREYAIRLQFRVGDGGNNPNSGWSDFPVPVEYTRQANNGDTLFMAPVTLPSSCNNQSLVQLRWVYYFKQGNSGNRALLAVDNIQVSSESLGAAALNVSPASLAPFDQVLGDPSPEKQVTVEGINITSDIVITAPENFEISTVSGSGFGSTITLTQTGGSVSSTTIFIRMNSTTAGVKNESIEFETTSSGGPLTVSFSVTGEAVESTAIPVLYINEILASNNAVFADEFDEFDDWIEIYNPNNFAVDLAGMYISDDKDNFLRYQFPTGSPLTVIPPRGFVLIWADNQSEQGPLHTNFAVSASGETIILTYSDGFTVIDSISFGAQVQNISYGREEDGGSDWITFNTPTPNSTNKTGVGVPLNQNKPLFTLYPNPATNRINFTKPIVFRMFSITGQVVHIVNAPVQEVEIGFLETGIYYLQSEEGQVVRFIKH